MDKTLLLIAIAAGALLGAALALLEPVPVHMVVLRSDPAAYDVSEVIEEARRIAKEAADDAG